MAGTLLLDQLLNVCGFGPLIRCMKAVTSCSHWSHVMSRRRLLGPWPVGEIGNNIMLCKPMYVLGAIYVAA